MIRYSNGDIYLTATNRKGSGYRTGLTAFIVAFD